MDQKQNDSGMKRARLVSFQWDSTLDDPAKSELNAARWKIFCKVWRAWRELSPDVFPEVLAEDHEYGSYWVLDSMHGRDAYCDYIKGKFRTIRRCAAEEGGGEPVVSVVAIQVGITTQPGNYAYALHFVQGNVKTMLTFRFEDGGDKIKSMYMIEPALYTLVPVDMDAMPDPFDGEE